MTTHGSMRGEGILGRGMRTKVYRRGKGFPSGKTFELRKFFGLNDQLVQPDNYGKVNRLF